MSWGLVACFVQWVQGSSRLLVPGIVEAVSMCGVCVWGLVGVGGVYARHQRPVPLLSPVCLCGGLYWLVVGGGYVVHGGFAESQHGVRGI